MIFLASEGCFWPLTASMTSEVKNNYAYVITQGICNKFIEVNFVWDVWFDGQIVCSKIERLSNIDEIAIDQVSYKRCKLFYSQSKNLILLKKLYVLVLQTSVCTGFIFSENVFPFSSNNFSKSPAYTPFQIMKIPTITTVRLLGIFKL